MSITTSPQTIANVNTSSLPDGVLTAYVILTDTAGLAGPPVTDSVVKSTDRIADQFSFTAQTNVAISTLVTSNSVIIAGLTTGYAAPVTITGGEWNKNGGAFTTASGTVVNGDVVIVRHTSSSALNTQVNTTLNVNSVTAVFSSTTSVSDAIPDVFTFTQQTGVNLNTVVLSNTVTPTGYNVPTAVSITNGEYSINGGAWTALSGSITPGQTIRVRHTSANAYNTPTITTLTIGGVQVTFQTVTAQNTVPQQFTFVDRTGIAPNTQTISNAITVQGITAAATIAISGGEYSVNSGNYTTSPGTVNNNDTVIVRITSSSTLGQTVNAILNIGGTTDTFSVTTIQADSTPNAFSFQAQTNVPVSAQIISPPITVLGINTAAVISINNGEYSINNGLWTANPGTVVLNDTVRVRHNSSATYNTQVISTLTIGGVFADFSSTTTAAVIDSVPDQFSFQPLYDVPLNTLVYSEEITVSGINIAVSISILNGEYSIESGPWMSTASNVTNGQKVRVRQLSSLNFYTPSTAVLSIGGVQANFVISTLPLQTPVETTKDQYSENQLIQYLLDNENNPPVSAYGLITNIMDQGDLLISYVCNSSKIESIDDTIQLNELHRKLLRHYIAGHILREDNDVQSKQLGAEELTLYEQQMAILSNIAITENVPDSSYEVRYNPLE